MGQALGIADILAVAYLHAMLDEARIQAEVRRSARLVVVAENQSVIGGLGEAAASLLVRSRLSPEVRQIALPDAFLAAGALPTLHDRYGISVSAMQTSIKTWLDQ